jgi:hypothetical protein
MIHIEKLGGRYFVYANENDQVPAGVASTTAEVNEIVGRIQKQKTLIVPETSAVLKNRNRRLRIR